MKKMCVLDNPEYFSMFLKYFSVFLKYFSMFLKYFSMFLKYFFVKKYSINIYLWLALSILLKIREKVVRSNEKALTEK